MTQRVVITGIGPVTSIGVGKDTFWNALLQKRTIVCPLPSDFEKNYTFHSRWYAPLPHFSLSDYEIGFHFESAMQQIDRMAVLAAKTAFEDAGYTVECANSRVRIAHLDSCSILLGIGVGALECGFDSNLAHRLPHDLLDRVNTEKRIKFHRMVIPASMPNSAAAWVSICFGIHGQSLTINASCASGTCAIGEAYRRIRDGYDSTIACGGVEFVRDSSGSIMRGFDMLGALTHNIDGFPRPFSKNRSGFLYAEGGACVLILESLEQARSRNAAIYAEVLDYRACSDAANIIQIEKEGTQISSMLRAISNDRHIDYLNAHGTGTLPNDEIEAKAIQTVFGNTPRQPLINSTKGILGHTLGASGAIEAAVAALSIKQDIVHGNLTQDPIDNLNLPIEPVETLVTTALSVSYGFGGHNAALLLGKVS
jgi:3-oxoacyl-[acyl-carrier-protein] synthase II